MTKKALWIVILAICITCLMVAGGFAIVKGVRIGAPAVPVVGSESLIAPVQDWESKVCEPSTIPFTDMGELDPDVDTVITGPAIYEWWLGGSDEGVQRVESGHTITIHGAKGHWWTLPNQAGLDCAWNLHVANYAAKPQHTGKTIAQLIISPPVEYLK